MNSSEICVVDSEADLNLYHFIDNCQDAEAKKYRGIVKDIGDKIVCQSFGHMDEISADDDNVANILKNNFPSDNWTVFEAQEGCLLRLFKHNEKWYLSTHKKLNAFNSFWSSKISFGELFVIALHTLISEPNELPGECFERFCKTLDEKYTWCFLLRNTWENRIVCHGTDKPELIYVGRFELEKFESSLIYNINENFPIIKEHKFENIEQLQKYVCNINPLELQGLIVLQFEDDKKTIKFGAKIMNPQYIQLSQLRGNVASLRFRYLELRQLYFSQKILSWQYFIALYSEHVAIFHAIDSSLLLLAKELYALYKARYIYKNNIKLNSGAYYILKKCHAWYLENGRNAPVTLDVVIEQINLAKPTTLNYLLKNAIVKQK